MLGEALLDTLKQEPRLSRSLVQSVTGGVGGAPFFPWIIREHLMEVEETPGWGEPSLCKGNSKCAFSPSFLASGLL